MTYAGILAGCVRVSVQRDVYARCELCFVSVTRTSLVPPVLMRLRRRKLYASLINVSWRPAIAVCPEQCRHSRAPSRPIIVFIASENTRPTTTTPCETKKH